MFNQSGQPPFGGGTPPDLSAMGKKFSKHVRRWGLIALTVIVIIVAVVGSVFTVNSGEEAVITRWGRYVDTITMPGLQFKLPFIDQRYIVNVDGVRRLEFGYRSSTDQEYPEEAIMLTQEENLVTADWVIQYVVDNSYNFLFKVENSEETLKIISQSAYRRVTAAHPLDDILTNQKSVMQLEIMKDLQEICDKYELGVRITGVQLQDAAAPDPVKAAFFDVTNAIEDKNAKINDASKYANEQLPQARGQAAALINEAEAYKAKRINEALGDVARYKAIEAEYAVQPAIMRTRLYLEMIQDVMPKLEKIYFVDSNGQRLDFLPLNSSATGG